MGEEFANQRRSDDLLSLELIVITVSNSNAHLLAVSLGPYRQLCLYRMTANVMSRF